MDVQSLWCIIYWCSWTTPYLPQRSVNFRVNIWSHRFSQNTNKKLSGFLPCVVRAEILTVFCSYFVRNDDFINSFWNQLTFSKAIEVSILGNNVIYYNPSPAVFKVLVHTYIPVYHLWIYFRLWTKFWLFA